MWFLVLIAVFIAVVILAARSFPDQRRVLARGVFSRKSVGRVDVSLPPSVWDEPWTLSRGHVPETLVHFADGRTFRANAEIDIPFEKGTPIVLRVSSLGRIIAEVDEELERPKQ